MYKQKTTNILTLYGLPIESDLISRGKQWCSDNTEIDPLSPESCLLINMINNNNNNTDNNNNTLPYRIHRIAWTNNNNNNIDNNNNNNNNNNNDNNNNNNNSSNKNSNTNSDRFAYNNEK